MKVTVFTGAGCSQCKVLKDQLFKASIDFDEKDVMDYRDEARDLNIRGLPTTVVTDYKGDVKEKFLGGSAFKDIEKFLKEGWYD